jgi:chorismate mutase
MIKNELLALRKQIDSVDSLILELTNLRMSLAINTVKYKGKVAAKKREKEVLKKFQKETKKLIHLDDKFTKKLFLILMEHSKKVQKESIKR